MLGYGWVRMRSEVRDMTITNHTPTGEYHARFYEGLDQHCPACLQLAQTRTHVFFHCPQYTPLHSSLTNWCNDRSNDKAWKLFFQHNLSAFTLGTSQTMFIEHDEFGTPDALCIYSATCFYSLHTIPCLLSPFGFAIHTKQLVCSHLT